MEPVVEAKLTQSHGVNGDDAMLTTIIVGVAIVSALGFLLGFLADQAGEPGGLLIMGGIGLALLDLVILAVIGGAHLWG